ncbi:unnamed protein product [Caenorhabditis auriculariae]|uniref:Uncharacterized protein n=1 Tax=Caenorhabditis auriculariae TaxID=2777116 RepID=A0A8S1H0Q0_9PELO|nr:unnamed protein product [Caenorhabditis auriculariae]
MTRTSLTSSLESPFTKGRNLPYHRLASRQGGEGSSQKDLLAVCVYVAHITLFSVLFSIRRGRCMSSSALIPSPPRCCLLVGRGEARRRPASSSST